MGLDGWIVQDVGAVVRQRHAPNTWGLYRYKTVMTFKNRHASTTVDKVPMQQQNT